MILMCDYKVLTYNGISKLYSNSVLKNHKNDIIEYQWFRPQIIKIASNLKIDTRDDLGVFYSNEKLGNKIIDHSEYKKYILNDDDDKYGFVPYHLRDKEKHEEIKNKITVLSFPNPKPQEKNNIVTNFKEISWQFKKFPEISHLESVQTKNPFEKKKLKKKKIKHKKTKKKLKKKKKKHKKKINKFFFFIFN